MPILGTLRQKLNVWMLGKTSVVKKQHLFPQSPDPDVVPAPPAPEQQLPPQRVSFLVSFAPRVHVGNHRPRDSTGRLFPRSDSHRSTHDESADAPRMHNDPGSSRDGQPIKVDAPDHVVLPRDVDMPSGEFDVEAAENNPNFQPVPAQFLEENPSVEPPLQSSF